VRQGGWYRPAPAEAYGGKSPIAFKANPDGKRRGQSRRASRRRRGWPTTTWKSRQENGPREGQPMCGGYSMILPGPGHSTGTSGVQVPRRNAQRNSYTTDRPVRTRCRIGGRPSSGSPGAGTSKFREDISRSRCRAQAIQKNVRHAGAGSGAAVWPVRTRDVERDRPAS